MQYLAYSSFPYSVWSHMCCSVFFTRNYIWRWIFQFFIATKDPQLFCPLLLWINVELITIISLLQWKLPMQLLLMMKTNRFNTVYSNFTLQCQHLNHNSENSEIFWLEVCFFLVTGVDINVKLHLLTDTDMLTTL